MTDGPYDHTATLECTNCGREFTTPADAEGSIKFDGVRDHGSEFHSANGGERWDYEFVSRPGGLRDA